MANKNLFTTTRGPLAPATTTRNDAGGSAYELSPEAALARLAVTGCLNSTFYASAGLQLDRVLDLANRVDPDFLTRTALHARRQGRMKDMPALLCAVLATRDLDRLIEIFPTVIDNGKMLRNFVQIIRSGVTGRKSLGSAPKRLVRQWLDYATDRQLINASIGASPSLADIVKMVHPHPPTPAREAFYAWLVGRSFDENALPAPLRAFEAWKRDRTGTLPDVPFQMLTAQAPDAAEWSAIADTASWQTTRMSLNTFARHGVFTDDARVEKIAARLANPDLIRKANAFPYQLLAAFLNTGAGVPASIRDALQQAMEISLANVPEIHGHVVVCPDVSGSMRGPVTGYRKGSTSRMRCIDVAALVAAAILRKNPRAEILPFEIDVVNPDLNPRDSVMTNATKLAAIGGGGTNCSAPLADLNRRNARPDLVIFVSDNESWADPSSQRATATMAEWEILRRRHPTARLVCVDLTPHPTAQAPDREDILNIAGFSDAVFDLIAGFASGGGETDLWLRRIELEPLRDRMKIA